MKNAPIKLIEINAAGDLQVYPDVAMFGDFKFIYRDASGVTWNETTHALVAREPERWDSVKLFGQILRAVISEYGIKLEIMPSTSWVNIPDALKAELIESAKAAYAMRGIPN